MSDEREKIEVNLSTAAEQLSSLAAVAGTDGAAVLAQINQNLTQSLSLLTVIERESLKSASETAQEVIDTIRLQAQMSSTVISSSHATYAGPLGIIDIESTDAISATIDLQLELERRLTTAAASKTSSDSSSTAAPAAAAASPAAAAGAAEKKAPNWDAILKPFSSYQEVAGIKGPIAGYSEGEVDPIELPGETSKLTAQVSLLYSEVFKDAIKYAFEDPSLCQEVTEKGLMRC